MGRNVVSYRSTFQEEPEVDGSHKCECDTKEAIRRAYAECSHLALPSYVHLSCCSALWSVFRGALAQRCADKPRGRRPRRRILQSAAERSAKDVLAATGMDSLASPIPRWKVRRLPSMAVSPSSVTEVAAPIASAYCELRESDPARTAWGGGFATLSGSHGS